MNWKKFPILLCELIFKIFNILHKKFFITQNIDMKKENVIEISYKNYSTKWSNLEDYNKTSPFILLLLGAVIGFINGFWGGGGGMLCVPTLTYIVGLEEKKSHATAILIMLPLCIASFVIYLINGYLNIQTTLIVGGGFIVGGLAGAYFLKKINNVVLKLIFSFVIIAGAIWLII